MFLLLEPVLLARTPKVGDRATYRVEGSFVVAGSPVTLRGTSAEEVTKVEDGAVTLRSLAKATLLAMGEERPLDDATETVTLRLDGAPVGPASRLRWLNMLVLPATPVEPGAPWWKVVERTSGRPAYRFDYRLIGEDRVGAWNAWKIAAEGGETDGATPAKVKATYWIDRQTGATLRTLAELTDAVLEPGQPALSGRLEVLRQS